LQSIAVIAIVIVIRQLEQNVVGNQLIFCNQFSGGSRNLERGFSHWRTKRTRNFLGCHAHLLSLTDW